MTTLAEIETAAEALSAAEKRELVLFLTSRLRAEGAPLPEPRSIPPEQLARWMEEDEADMRQFAQQSSER